MRLSMCRWTSRRERGFALVLAMLSLLLLTFLGLTLAMTTSTELQIATNYRWSQQALYNAEAGIEVGKALLRTMEWSVVLPGARTTPWLKTAPTTPPLGKYARPDKTGAPTRNFENGSCDMLGGHVGYGVVLDNGSAEAPYQNVSDIFDRRLNGAFTVWVRRPLVTAMVTADDAGVRDSTDDTALVLTSEGTAPFGRGALGGQYTAINRAAQVVEANLSSTASTPCGTRGGQVGGGPEGSNFSPCDPITGAGLTGSGGAGATGSGAEIDGIKQ